VVISSCDVYTLLGVAMGAVILIYTGYANRIGRIVGRFQIIDRSDHPRLFRAYSTTYTAIGVFNIAFIVFFRLGLLH
jgi:hypothetical protein